MNRRVVITGMGCVHAAGTDNDSFFGSLDAMRVPAVPLPAEFLRHHSYRTGFMVPLPEIDLAAHGIRTGMDKAMQPEDRLSLVATKMALEDAGVALEPREGGWDARLPEGTAMILGTGFTGLQAAFDSYLAHVGLRRDPERRSSFNRMVIPMLMNNSPAAWCAVLFGLRGPVHTVNAACASGSVAIGEAFDKIRLGLVPAALCGGVENLKEDSGAILRGFDQMGVCTRSVDGNPNPFSVGRSGFLFAEGGGCMLLLEERDSAISRGARIYAEVVGHGENNDGFGIAQLAPDGARIRSLARSVLGGRTIEVLNAHGTGTSDNDRIESELLADLWPEEGSRPLVQCSKSLLGHSFGASGAFEAAICARSLCKGVWHGSRSSDLLPGVSLLGETKKLDATRALSLSLGFGGHNTALLLERHGG